LKESINLISNKPTYLIYLDGIVYIS
jgi:hypothetical protein